MKTSGEPFSFLSFSLRPPVHSGLPFATRFAWPAFFGGQREERARWVVEERDPPRDTQQFSLGNCLRARLVSLSLVLLSAAFLRAPRNQVLIFSPEERAPISR